MSKIKKVLAIIGSVFLFLGVVVYGVLQLPAFGGVATGDRLARMKASPEYKDGRFENTPPHELTLRLVENFRLYQQGQIREPQFAIPVHPMSVGSLQAPPSSGLRATWFGHASVLVEIGGVRLFTDPVLSEYASPFAVGPSRFHPPPVGISEIQNIDAVLISHDHYDHLDMETVKKLSSQGTQFFVGLGIGAHLERWGVPLSQIHEMEWWDMIDLKGVQIYSTPSRHYSGRKRTNNPTLWSAWVVKSPTQSFYFSGDTGYGPHFAEVRKRLGDMDLTAIKVGAYGSTWLEIHMDPEHAIKAHQDLGGAVLLPIHWATFNLAYHSWEEPILRSVAAAEKAVPAVKLITPEIGQTYNWGQDFTNKAWYQPPTAN